MKKIKNKIIQNNTITIPILLLSLALVFTFGTPAVSAAPNDTIYVNGTGGNDSWDGLSWGTAKLSIKNATGTVNVNGTVNLANGIYNGSDNRGIIISKNMTIQGQSQAGTVIDAQGADRIFTINSGVNVTIQNLTLENAYAPKGSAVYNFGTLNVENTTFIGNTATPSSGYAPTYGGGAIWSTLNTNLTVKNSTFIGNTAIGSGGGAIVTESNALISNTTFANNHAWYGGGAIFGGIQSNLTVKNNTFTSNSAGGYGGGAIYNDILSTINVENSTFTSNTANIGGAIANQGDLTVTDNIFTDNTATDSGGAIWNIGTSTVTNSNFTNNTASYQGGAIWNNANLDVNNSTFTGNKAKTESGGAIWTLGTLTVNDSEFINNTASYSGGAISSPATLNINNSTFKGNQAGYLGGAISNNGTLNIKDSTFDSNAAYHGGAINKDGATLNVNGSTFTNNTAQSGSAIFNYYSTSTVDNCTFTDNIADGGTINNNAGGSLTVTGSNFSGNTAHYTGGAIVNANICTVSGSTFTDNTAGWFGGAISNEGTSLLNVTDCTFKNNTAPAGGAISNYGGAAAEVHFNRIVGNSPNNSEIYNESGIVNAQNNWWGSNTSPSGRVQGNVIYNPWLVLNIAANPTIIYNGETSHVTADLWHDSKGVYHDPVLGHVPDGIPIILTVPWGSFTNPAINYSVTLNTLNGGVSAIFHANEGAAPLNPVKVTAAADGYTTNDVESAYITINPAAEVQLTKTASNIKPNVGQMFTFTVTARNNGPDTATGVQITDLIPDGLIFNGYTVSQGTYDPKTGIWVVGTILNGSSAVLNLFVTPTLMAAATKVTNTAVLTAEDQYDSTDDIATASVYVQPVVIIIQKTSILTMCSIMEYGVSCIDPTVKAARTTGMDPTGVPLAGFIVAVLMVLSGLTIPRKK